MTEVFWDTSLAIALSSMNDCSHIWTVELAEQIEINRTHLVTTQAILLEIGKTLSKERYRTATIELLESLETDPTVEIVLLTNSLYRSAFSLFNLFKQRKDKEWGLLDCIPFPAMQERGITNALSADTTFSRWAFEHC